MGIFGPVTLDPLIGVFFRNCVIVLYGNKWHVWVHGWGGCVVWLLTNNLLSEWSC